MQSIEIFIDEKDRRVMKKSVLATIMAGTMVLGMTACGTKPTETTAEPTTTTTAQETTAETTTAETTEETTAAQPERPALAFAGPDRNMVTNIQVTNITHREVDGKEYFGDDPAFEGLTVPVYEAKADQDIVITFDCNESLVLRQVDNSYSDKVKDGCTLAKDGNTYTLTILANTFSAGDTCIIMLQTEDAEWDAEGNPLKGSSVTATFNLI